MLHIIILSTEQIGRMQGEKFVRYGGDNFNGRQPLRSLPENPVFRHYNTERYTEGTCFTRERTDISPYDFVFR